MKMPDPTPSQKRASHDDAHEALAEALTLMRSELARARAQEDIAALALAERRAARVALEEAERQLEALETPDA